MRAPRVVAIGAGGTALSTLYVNLFVLEGFSGLLLAVSVPAALLCAASIRNILNFSPRAVARLRDLAVRLDGRFWLWRAGTGGHRGVPFEYAVEQQRFAVVTGAIRGMPIEAGNLSSQGSARHRARGGRRHGYVAFRLPERLPHMIVSFGHLSKAFGVRVFPDQWHRSQLVDVGGGRRFRLFVADGGEVVARSFFRPEMVELLTRVGRSHDVEIRDRSLYLLASRSPAAGSERRWAEEQRLLEELAGSLAGSTAWESVRGMRRRLRGEVLRGDLVRTSVLVFGFAAIAIVVISLVVLWSMGYIG